MRLPAFGFLAIIIASSGIAAEESPPVPLYDPDPKHLWNRLHAAISHRVGPDGEIYGHDRVDPVRWRDTIDLLGVPSRTAFAHVLQEFLEKRGETLIEDPLKRAMLQRDLWAIFDWLAGTNDEHHLFRVAADAKPVLREPLAQVIARLALDADEIAKLPDTYAAAVAGKEFPANFDPAKPEASFLPTNLFDPLGSWVCVGRNGSSIIAPVHLESFSRSSFQVLLRLPAGRTETAKYIDEISSFKEPFVMTRLSDGRFVPQSNPNLPQFPAGTQVAFVRSALLIDSKQKLHATRIVESIQLRVYNDFLGSAGNYEFVLNRARLFAGKSGGLRAVDIDERDFNTNFNAHQSDKFDGLDSAADGNFAQRLGVVRHRCTGCHKDGGVHSFLTFVGGFSHRNLLPSLYDANTTKRGETAAISNKQTRYDWGLLEGLLLKANVTP